MLTAGKDFLYVVCSILPEEGLDQIREFVSRHPDAQLKDKPGLEGGMLRLIPTECEKNPVLPRNHDGFFYALLTKEPK